MLIPEHSTQNWNFMFPLKAESDVLSRVREVYGTSARRDIKVGAVRTLSSPLEMSYRELETFPFRRQEHTPIVPNDTVQVDFGIY
jgi:hypothetical protein